MVAVTAGWQHIVALKHDGTVVAWGTGYAGQTNIPSGLSNVIAIAAGGHHTLVQLADGSLASWGDSGGLPGSWPSTLLPIRGMAAAPSQNLLLLERLCAVSFSLRTSGTDTQVFRQTGLTRQVVLAHNASPTSFPAVRLTVLGLSPGAKLWNAHGFDTSGNPFVVSHVALAPGASLELTLEFYTADRSTPQFSVVSEAIEAEPSIVPEGQAQSIGRSLRLDDGSYLLDFVTVPART